MKPTLSGGRPAARTSSSMPCWWKISMVRALMPRALGWIAVPGWRSTSSDLMPSRDSISEAVRPTGPPPAIKTGTSFMTKTSPVRIANSSEPLSGVMRPIKPLEALGEVGLEVLDILQPDMDAQHLLARGPRHGAAVVVWMGWNHQAFVATP